MSGVLSTLTAIVLMAALGLRHGIDPEHIAIVNNVALRAVEKGSRNAALTGLWFALGHGLMATVFALGLLQLIGAGDLPLWAQAVVGWLPMAILFLVASVNLRQLLNRQRRFQPSNFKTRVLPAFLRDATHPAAVFVIGILFAPFVDPATQTAVWAYAVGTSGTALEVVGLGCVFTAAMAFTFIVETRGVLLLLQGADAQRANRRQRAIGWVIVILSYGIFAYDLISRLPAVARPRALEVTALLVVIGALGWWCHRHRMYRSRRPV